MWQNVNVRLILIPYIEQQECESQPCIKQQEHIVKPYVEISKYEANALPHVGSQKCKVKLQVTYFGHEADPHLT